MLNVNREVSKEPHRVDRCLVGTPFESVDRSYDRAIYTATFCILALHPGIFPPHPPRSLDKDLIVLLVRANYLFAKFQHAGKASYIAEAIALDREALRMCPPDHFMRFSVLIQPARHLWRRYWELGGIDDIHEAIDLCRDALVVLPLGHADLLTRLAHYLSIRYSRLGQTNDLSEAIELDRASLALRPPGHPDRLASLNNLAAHLAARYEEFGDVNDISEGIVLTRDALAVLPSGDPSWATVLSNLSIHFHFRYGRFGGVDDLDEAITLSRNALAFSPPGEFNRSTIVNNVAYHLSSRYKLLGGMDDLNEAIDLERETLVLRPPGHPDRASSLNGLAVQLSFRFKRLRRISDLEEAIVLGHGALALSPQGYPGSLYSHNLATSFWCRYQQFGSIDDLNEAIGLERNALASYPLGHSLDNLTLCLSARYKCLGEINDLNEAIVLGRNTLLVRPPGCPDRSSSLEHLAEYLCIRLTQLGKVEDRDELFGLYSKLEHVSHTFSSSDLSAAKAWANAAEQFHHPTTLLAYETALRLLVEHLAALPSLPQHLSILKSHTSSLAADAFSACIRNRSPTKAVELLEQGRSVFWGQLTRLRSPLDDVIASGSEGRVLADKFARLTSLIRIALNSPATDQHDQICRLNVKLREVLFKIRALPGLSRFILPSLFSDLQCAASGGPVIIVNASRYGCDVLVVFPDKDPAHIPLSVTKEDIRDLSSKLRTLTELSKRLDVTRDLGLILRQLWDHVVSPIVDFLQTTYPLQSRIWWCPTAEFSLLPLHAAGPYRKGQRNLSDLYVSSYTPTLTALIRARRPTLAHLATQRKRFIAIGQANAGGTDHLPFVSTELANIGQLVDGHATFTRIDGHASSITRVARELGKHAWVHIACHGVPNQQQPFESAFALSDGRFTIQHILGCELANPEFAYLSACHTTVGDEACPDEAIHLASAMQFAGFRSVIGTMWAVEDAHTSKVTSKFYSCMMDEAGGLDHTYAAVALRKAIKSANISLDQRILYIHLGA